MKNLFRPFLQLRFFRSIVFCVVGLTPLTILSILFIVKIYGNPTEGTLALYFAENLIVQEELTDWGYEYSEIAYLLNALIWKLNLSLLIATITASIAWSTYSHYLNVDAPGKAKIYFIHWIVITGIYVAILFGINWFFVETDRYEAAQFIDNSFFGGSFQIFIFTMVYYFAAYYTAVFLGTARFARSSVLFANKLPGNL